MRNKMRIDGLTSIVESAVADQGNTRMGYKKAADTIGRLIENGKKRPADFSIQALAEASLREADKPNLDELKYEDAERISEELSGTAFPILTNTVINAELIPQYEPYDQQIDQLVTRMESTNTYKETIGGLEPMEGLRYVPEKHPHEETDMNEKKVEIYQGKFENGISISEEMVYNDQTGRILQRARDVGMKAGQQMSQAVIQTIIVRNRELFEFETSGTFYAAVFNGTALTQAQFYSTDHSSLSAVHGGQTNSNKLTTALSTAGLDEARLLFSGMKDERGDKIMVQPRTLLVPESLHTTANQLLFTTQGQYDTANNAKNPFAGNNPVAAYNLFVSPWLDDEDTSAWYLGDFQSQVAMLEWKPLTVTSQNSTSESAFNRGIVQRHKASLGFGVGMRDIVYCVYSDGST